MFCRIWREGTCYLLSKILSALPRSFGNSFNTSCHADCCLRTQLFSRARYLGVFWHQVSTSSHSDLRPKKLNSLSLFPLTKRVLLPALRLRPIIWLSPPLPPPPPPPPVVLTNDLHSLLRPTKLGLWSADILTYILTGFVTSFNRLTTRNSLSFIFLFYLCGLLIQTQKGRGKWSYYSPLSGIPRDS